MHLYPSDTLGLIMHPVDKQYIVFLLVMLIACIKVYGLWRGAAFFFFIQTVVTIATYWKVKHGG